MRPMSMRLCDCASWDWNNALKEMDFYHVIPDERLIAYSRIPLLERLRWLDEICRFTLAMRAAPSEILQDLSEKDADMNQLMAWED